MKVIAINGSPRKN